MTITWKQKCNGVLDSRLCVAEDEAITDIYKEFTSFYFFFFFLH